MSKNANRMVRVALVQMSMSNDTKDNLEKALQMAEAAAKQGADIICLPELFLGPYFCKTENPKHFDRTEPIPGPTTKAFTPLANTYDVTLILSLFEKRAPGLYHNTAAILDGKKGYLGKYRKMHIPDDPMYYEKFYFTPGDLGFCTWNTRPATIGTLICWDQWYPEAARLTAMKGAEILFYPTAIGWLASEKEQAKAQHNAWETIQRSHAIANGCFVVAVNRVGYEAIPEDETPEIDTGIGFWGQSFVAAPNGEIIARASSDQEEILIVNLNLTMIEETRRWWPFFRDRRIDAYTGLDRRFLTE